MPGIWGEEPVEGVRVVLEALVVSAIVAVVCHEAAHVLVAGRYGGRFVRVVFRAPFLAVVVDHGGVPDWASVPIGLAGPASDLALVLLAIALCHLGVLSPVQGLGACAWPAVSFPLNLLPIPRADGWRVLRTLLA